MKQNYIYEEEHLTVSYDEDNGWLYNNWIGFQSDVLIKKGGEAILNALKSKKCSRVLNDNREVTGAWPGSVEWASKEWTPKMIEAGLEYFAWIYPEKMISQMSATRMVKQTKDEEMEKFQFFSNLEEAMNWLKKVENLV